MRKFLFIALIICGGIPLLGQINVVLNPSESKATCYDIMIKNTSAEDVHLAGQNYRIYYSAENSSFNAHGLKSYLPKEFTTMSIVQNMEGDATGYGALPFEKNLGFINLATDYHLESKSYLTIDAYTDYKVAQICFTDNPPSELVWAAPGLTDGYATAFNQMAQVMENGMLEKLNINEHIVNIPTNKSDMPVAFQIGNASESIALNNNLRQVSEGHLLDHIKKHFKGGFDRNMGQYVVLASLTEQNKNSLQWLDKSEISEQEDMKVVFKYFDHLEEAKKYHRRFINVGFEDANLFNVGEYGNLQLVKRQ